jgi:hypothetical protein
MSPPAEPLPALLARHAARRARGVPTVSVLVGPEAASAALVLAASTATDESIEAAAVRFSGFRRPECTLLKTQVRSRTCKPTDIARALPPG